MQNFFMGVSDQGKKNHCWVLSRANTCYWHCTATRSHWYPSHRHVHHTYSRDHTLDLACVLDRAVTLNAAEFHAQWGEMSSVENSVDVSEHYTKNIEATLNICCYLQVFLDCLISDRSKKKFTEANCCANGIQWSFVAVHCFIERARSIEQISLIKRIFIAQWS